MGSSERQTDAVWLELWLSWQGWPLSHGRGSVRHEGRLGAVLWAMDLWKGLRLFYMTIDSLHVLGVHVHLRG